MPILHKNKPTDTPTDEGQPKETLYLLDYLQVGFAFGTLPPALFVHTAKNALKRSKRRPIKDTVINTVLKHFFEHLSFKQLRKVSMDGPMKEKLDSLPYKLTFARRGLNNYNEPFEGQGFKARWIHEVPNRGKDDPVILYFHGGGYVVHMSDLQGFYICELARILKPYRVSILALDYGIAPFYKNPTQREESVACLAKLQESCTRPILLGDSCGGNMALTVLLEEERIPPQSVFGVALISPAADPLARSGSMNNKHDILTRRVILNMMYSWLQKDNLEDPRSNPVKQDPRVWDRVLPKNVCVVYGQDDCLRDQIEDWKKSANVDNFYIEKNGTHDCILRGVNNIPSRFVTNSITQWIIGKGVN